MADQKRYGRNVGVEVDSTQIEAGKEYRGSISFDKTRFNYRMKVSEGFDSLLKVMGDLDYARKQIQIDVKDNRGRNVELCDEARRMFLSRVGPLAVELYTNPQMKMASQIEEAMKGSGLLEALGGNVIFGGAIMMTGTQYRLPMVPELERFLTDFKSGKLVSGPSIYDISVLSDYLTKKQGSQPKNIKDANLSGIEIMVTPKKNGVKIRTDDGHGPKCTSGSDLAIIGGSSCRENQARVLKGSGLIAARFSSAYGGPSKCCGSLPQDKGYSLDIPKEVSVVKDLLFDDDTLEAIASREEGEIRKAIKRFNSNSNALPILITPYLKEALKIEQDKSNSCIPRGF